MPNKEEKYYIAPIYYMKSEEEFIKLISQQDTCNDTLIHCIKMINEINDQDVELLYDLKFCFRKKSSDENGFETVRYLVNENGESENNDPSFNKFKFILTTAQWNGQPDTIHFVKNGVMYY